jgi:prepilin-type N-terminal cleavage/methylation domain-containing protein
MTVMTKNDSVTAGPKTRLYNVSRFQSREAGFSLLETMVALTILLVVAAGVIPLGVVAFTTSENGGHLSSRAAEYAQDKLEQLMALSYSNTTSDTRVFPTPELGGSGLVIGGSVDPAAPSALYVDYLDVAGTLIPSVGGAPPADWYYQRLWQVTSPKANLKQITVLARVRRSSGNWVMRPNATVTALKTFPF